MEENRPNEMPSAASPDRTPFEPSPQRRNFWQRNGMTILTVAILGLVIGGAFAVNQRRVNDELDQDDVSLLDQTPSTTSTPQVIVGNNPTTTPSVSITDNKSSDVKTPVTVVVPTQTPTTTPTTPVATIEDGKGGKGGILGAASSDGTLTVTAVRGNGRTHLARRAISQQLQATNSSLTAAQRIYAEDYLTKKYTPKVRIKIGQSVTYSVDQINEAISASQNLTSAQVQHLQQYTSSVNFSAP